MEGQKRAVKKHNYYAGLAEEALNYIDSDLEGAYDTQVLQDFEMHLTSKVVEYGNICCQSHKQIEILNKKTRPFCCACR